MAKLSKQPHVNTIRDLLKGTSAIQTVSTLDKFASLIHRISEDWQREDWRAAEGDEDVLLNNVRLVGQAWFRGQRTRELTLKPGLYRDSTRENLKKTKSSPVPAASSKTLREELFDLEHELRIDFT